MWIGLFRSDPVEVERMLSSSLDLLELYLQLGVFQSALGLTGLTRPFVLLLYAINLTAIVPT